MMMMMMTKKKMMIPFTQNPMEISSIHTFMLLLEAQMNRFCAKKRVNRNTTAKTAKRVSESNQIAKTAELY